MEKTGVPVLDEPVKRLMQLDQCSVFALADIAQERLRQIEKEGWSAVHDDAHRDGELADAAACYAAGERGLVTSESLKRHMSIWPWDIKWWKPRSPHRNRVRAGALLVAELARHFRSAPSA